MRSIGYHATVTQSLLSRDATTEPAAADVENPPVPTDAAGPVVTERLQRKLAEDTVNRVTVPEDGVVTDLPSLNAPELKLIGRSVSFGLKQTINGTTAVYYYTGVVATVTATAVTLLHVTRYTESDHKEYKAREKRLASAARVVPGDFTHGEADTAEVSPSLLILASADVPSGGTITAAAATGAAAAHGTADADVHTFSYSLSDVFGGGFSVVQRMRTSPQGSLTPAVAMPKSEELEPCSPQEHGDSAATAHGHGEGATAADVAVAHPRPPHFRTYTGSVAHLACVTVLRKNLRDVTFGRDPTCSFYSGFHSPAHHITDTQHFKMLVRRYLVHTSMHNNPDRLSLYAYLTQRGGFCDVDRGVALQTVREELTELMKQERAIAKERRRLRRSEARREEAIRGYRAPEGIFADTGVLYLTGLPQGSLLTAAMLLFFTLAFAGNYISTVELNEDWLIRGFCKKLSRVVLPSLLVWTLSGMLLLYHSLHMRMPALKTAPMLVLRTATAVLSGMCCVLCISVVTKAITNDAMMESLLASNKRSLCSFYDKYQCSGFYAGCGLYPAYDPLCQPCLPIAYPNTPCYSDITDQMQRIMIPLFLFSIVLFLTSVHSLFLLLKLFMVFRSSSVATHATS